MNSCLYCEASVPAFRAFCDATCEGLFGIAETAECGTCQEDFRVSSYTREGRPILSCPSCLESFEVVAQEVA